MHTWLWGWRCHVQRQDSYFKFPHRRSSTTTYLSFASTSCRSIILTTSTSTDAAATSSTITAAAAIVYGAVSVCNTTSSCAVCHEKSTFAGGSVAFSANACDIVLHVYHSCSSIKKPTHSPSPSQNTSWKTELDRGNPKSHDEKYRKTISFIINVSINKNYLRPLTG